MQRLNIPFAYGGLALLLTLSSCGNNLQTASSASQVAPYFSLATFFGKEAERLQQHNPEITKTVTKNGEEERKNMHIADWKEELALFIDADINKPAWQNSYRVDSVGSTITYTSTDSTLRTREIRIDKDAGTGAVIHIRVTNQVSNMLYQTNERLDYYVDSLYRIVKRQDVRVIGKSHYTVTGEWL